MADNSAPSPVTAAMIVIGDEILSGRTQDTNFAYVAKFLGALGIDLKEARFVADDTAEIVEAVNALPRPLHLCLHLRRHRPHP